MTDDLFVDPDALLAGAEVARRQHAHLQRTSDYISDACSQFGAFSGVLNLFEGQYREASQAFKAASALSGTGMTAAAAAGR